MAEFLSGVPVLGATHFPEKQRLLAGVPAGFASPSIFAQRLFRTTTISHNDYFAQQVVDSRDDEGSFPHGTLCSPRAGGRTNAALRGRCGQLHAAPGPTAGRSPHTPWLAGRRSCRHTALNTRKLCSSNGHAR